MGEDKRLTNYKKIKSLKLNEFAEWLDKYSSFEDSPWVIAFDKKFCQNCESITTVGKYQNEEFEAECCYCELNEKCKYFKKEMNGIDMIKWWLKQYD